MEKDRSEPCRARNDNTRTHRLTVGYARVSTPAQRLDLQTDALRTAGCDVIYADIAPGDDLSRQGLARALGNCRNGDVLMVWKLDRLCRDLFGLLQMLKALSRRGVVLKVLMGGGTLDNTTAEGRLLLGILACMAEFELELIRERTRAGIQSAQRRRQLHGKRLATLPSLGLTDLFNAACV